jgi:predicted transcriptional regulator
VNSQLLINTIVQQTMVFIAQLATAGGVRAPLARVADDVFLGLTRELSAQGLEKKVIADMFGMGLRTYHRRVQSLEQSKSFAGKTVWEAVLEFVQQHEPVTTARILERFAHDDTEIVSGVLNDLVQSGLAYRSGRAQSAVYRFANEADFLDPEGREEANRYLVWLSAYRQGPITAEQISAQSHVSGESVQRALAELIAEGKVLREGERYRSERFDVPCGAAKGWEAAVLDHYQALVSAVSMKLRGGARAAGTADTVGGSTWSLDVWPGHPLEAEAKSTLKRVRGELEGLRERIDAVNAGTPGAEPAEQVVVYLGQYVRACGSGESEQFDETRDVEAE